METLAKKKEMEATKPAKSFSDLLNFDDDASAPSQASGIDLLNDLLSGDGSISAPTTPAKTTRRLICSETCSETLRRRRRLRRRCPRRTRWRIFSGTLT